MKPFVPSPTRMIKEQRAEEAAERYRREQEAKRVATSAKIDRLRAQRLAAEAEAVPAPAPVKAPPRARAKKAATKPLTKTAAKSTA